MMKRKKYLNPHPDDLNYAFICASKYLSLRARSEEETKNFLLKKRFNPQIIPQIINRLKDLRFLNDEDYAKSFMRTRQEYKGKSKYFIKYELKQKGLPDELINEISNKAQDDLQTAKDFIKRKKRIFSSLNKKEFKEKMTRLLSSRGFSFDIMRQALKEDE